MPVRILNSIVGLRNRRNDIITKNALIIVFHLTKEDKSYNIHLKKYLSINTYRSNYFISRLVSHLMIKG